MERQMLEEIVFKAALNTQEIVRGLLSDLDVEYEQKIQQVQSAKKQILASFPKQLSSMKVKDLSSAGWNIEAALYSLSGLQAPNYPKSPQIVRSKTPQLQSRSNTKQKLTESASKKSLARWKC
jgi:hypothetical protein